MADTTTNTLEKLHTSGLIRRDTKTNTLILTGAELHAPENQDLLDKLIEGLKESVPVTETVRASKLSSLKKTVFVFSSVSTSERVHDILESCGLKASYSLWDNVSPLEQYNGPQSADVESMLLNGTLSGSHDVNGTEDLGKWSLSPNATTETSDVPNPVFKSNYLQLPDPGTTILQSPPGSPYLEYVPELAEEAPDKISISDPQSLSHLMYQTTLEKDSYEKARPSDTEVQVGKDNILVFSRDEIRTLFPDGGV
ncbi:unnamed protein product [Kuraishia capsulata CBS 1993]|uniref:Uncharacterized protein n=1 Tax=Kuraishia capsulata CBS 1993 TaxID=1382522 RepID=W6MTA3_9ASCO|nr:uncharacterized protein KUCA_T00004409001 [Kuraishia capsulata CBS 1993]CDK28427.1 unnamed protein product [Kuraishia capsulata CBS 1993]